MPRPAPAPARGATPVWLGLWWVHGLVALLAWAVLGAPRWLGRR